MASIVAGKLADEGKGAEVVSIMIAGMTVVNLFGVPLGTSLSHMLSWRVTFLLVGCWGIIVLYYIARWVLQMEGIERYRIPRSVPFLEEACPLALAGCHGVGQRRCILLV